MPFIKHDDCNDPHGFLQFSSLYDLANALAHMKWKAAEGAGPVFSPSGIAYEDGWSDARIAMIRQDWIRCRATNDLFIKERWIREHGASDPPNAHDFVRAVDEGWGTPQMNKLKGW